MKSARKNGNLKKHRSLFKPEAVFLVMCDPSTNEL